MIDVAKLYSRFLFCIYQSQPKGLYFGLGFANFESNSPKRPSKIFPKNFIESLHENQYIKLLFADRLLFGCLMPLHIFLLTRLISRLYVYILAVATAIQLEDR